MKPKIVRRPVNGILLLDKPLGLSSNEALQQVKRLYRAEKAGHTGSLDPLATGMLPLCFGQATKLCGYLLDSDKAYRAQVSLGARTSTGDTEGEVVARSDPSQLSRSELEQALRQFVGEIEQVPPMYSALKHQGERLYELARRGEEVVRNPRRVKIHELRLLDFMPGRFELEVRCSKGTYIRTLAEDIAQAVGQMAHLAGLRRIAVSPFDAPMVSKADLEAAAERGETALDGLLLDTCSALTDWPQLQVDDVRAQALSHGKAVYVASAPRSVQVAVKNAAGQLLCMAESDSDGLVQPRRWMA